MNTFTRLATPQYRLGATVKQFYTILFAQSNDQHSLQAVKRITNTNTYTHTQTHTFGFGP